ncbi:MAG: DUF4277 domain-containing protein [Moorea sp. SIO3I8]|nr:DUF4277 domain-containing protein [Moorena sp. SIO3I8]
MSKIEASNIRVQDLDHCGIVAGICDEIQKNAVCGKPLVFGV